MLVLFPSNVKEMWNFCDLRSLVSSSIEPKAVQQHQHGHSYFVLFFYFLHVDSFCNILFHFWDYLCIVLMEYSFSHLLWYCGQSIRSLLLSTPLLNSIHNDYYSLSFNYRVIWHLGNLWVSLEWTTS